MYDHMMYLITDKRMSNCLHHNYVHFSELHCQILKFRSPVTEVVRIYMYECDVQYTVIIPHPGDLSEI
jgi:hypothetical protein